MGVTVAHRSSDIPPTSTGVKGTSALASGTTSAHPVESERTGSNTPSPGLDMATLRYAVDTTTGPSDAAEAADGQAEQWQQDIGYGGELFVFELLKHTFHAGDDCWTSDLRSRAGLSAFPHFAGDYSDFTISDPEVCQHIATWLNDSGQRSGPRLFGNATTYHLEVKATVGRCREPFAMSNSQVAKAHMLHASTADVYIILRVYDLLSSPKVYAYVDPFALMLDGKLSFKARGGYSVQPV